MLRVALAYTWTVHQSKTFCGIDLLRLNQIHNLCQRGPVTPELYVSHLGSSRNTRTNSVICLKYYYSLSQC